MPAPSTSTVIPATQFVQLTTEQQRKTFYASLQGPKWWIDGGKKDSDRGWVEIFKQSNWKCVYCERDLAASTDALAESTEEHLVPRSLLEPNGAEPNVANNMAACCSGCNGLKGEHVPAADAACWKTRKAYVKACFRFVSARRLKNFLRYRDHVEGALKMRAGQ